jgi:hypothetical protein
MGSAKYCGAAIYGLGHLPADEHQFILPARRQSRRPDVRLHRGLLRHDEWISLRGLLVARPSRTAADLLADQEDPQAVAHVVADALRPIYDYPGTVARALAPHAGRFGLPHGDGLAIMRWLLDLTRDPERAAWLDEARVSLARDDSDTRNR